MTRSVVITHQHQHFTRKVPNWQRLMSDLILDR